MKLNWECIEGHQWYANPNNIKQGTWYPMCRKNENPRKPRKSIDDMIRINKKREMVNPLSTQYINADIKLIWRCSEGHKW